MTEPNELHQLAAAYGVDTAYHDWQGAARTVSADSLRAILATFGIDAGSPEACRAALAAQRDAAGRRVLPPTVVLRAGQVLHLPLPAGSELGVEFEDGTRRALDAGAGLPADLPLGYHHLVARVGTAEHRAHLIVTPDRLALLPRLLERPGWGLATQLYSVRSAGSWGVGDLADLRTIAGWTAREHGADFVLVNPVHAGEVVAPLDPSPYLPTSRRFANPLYLRVEDVTGYAELDDEQRAGIERLGAAVRESAGRQERIERDPVWVAKLAALEIVHRATRSVDDPHAAYRAFRSREGTPLDRFATWCVLCEEHGKDWRQWPEALRDPGGAGVARFAASHADRVDFFRWLQWQLDEQLTAAQTAARAAGMAVGIVHDVAVGVSPAGADAWARQDAMATSVTVGAPPDAYSQQGQDWQQPPWRPDRLAELGYAPFREMFGAALRHCGGLRVDHIIGLFRLWWIPAGREALDGTYVHYDHDALTGVLMLEAHRAGAVIIGEDLGNVEPSARDYLRERGLLGTSILWFESDPHDRGPLRPERWREYCLASVTTHDLPPSAGYLAGEHIRLRDDLGLLTRSLDEELAVGRAERDAWLDLLEALGLLEPADRADTEPVVLALHRYLTLTPARLRCVALTDAVGERRTQNQPGTSDEYPNWQVPLAGPDGAPVTLEAVMADPRVARLLDSVREPRASRDSE